MPKSLERDLGLFATTTISIGTMVGSGIFVLPGLAAGKAGPSAILAYLLAGLIVLPAALSKAEMATAIPESGGTYLYIDRAMGPLPGTIAGIGAWFSLVFKSAFALVGLGAYLLLFAPIPDSLLVFVSLGLGVFLVAVNVSGAKLTGRLQVAVVSCVLLVLLGFVGDGLTYVSHARYHPFFAHGADGLFAATGLVFVSYAGVTKIASVAEEVENPGRNIPIAILASVLLMMVVYTLTVFVVIGVAPMSALAHDLTPMTTAALAFAGRFGEVVVAAVAVLALTSMANAGVLSSSRYPLAMSRDSLAPSIAGRVSERFKTPVVSIAFTGAVLLCLVAFVPVINLAKLASAFQILVFALVNVALVAFRESSLDWYDPAFRAPGYPFVQVAGFVASALLLTQMGWIPLAGATGIVALGALWYRVYGRARTTREGAAMETLRETAAVDGASVTDAALDAPDGDVLVARERARLGGARARTHRARGGCRGRERRDGVRGTLRVGARAVDALLRDGARRVGPRARVGGRAVRGRPTRARGGPDGRLAQRPACGGERGGGPRRGTGGRCVALGRPHGPRARRGLVSLARALRRRVRPRPGARRLGGGGVAGRTGRRRLRARADGVRARGERGRATPPRDGARRGRVRVGALGDAGAPRRPRGARVRSGGALGP